MDAQGKNIRPSYVAGQFYPGDARELRAMIDTMIAEAEPSSPPAEPSSAWAVILPHAGYVYSGPTAIKTLLPLRGRPLDRIVAIAPSHRYPFRGLVGCDFDTYQTPLGRIPVDTAAMRTLIDGGGPLVKSTPEPHLYEHALEVELPLLQQMFPAGFQLIPLICGEISPAAAGELAPLLAPLATPGTLFVVSSDFTHFGRNFGYAPFRDRIPEQLKELDLGAVELIRHLDLDGFERYLRDTGATICGANPIKLLLALTALVAPASRVELGDYTTSGAMTGDYSHCVSYAGMRFCRS